MISLEEYRTLPIDWVVFWAEDPREAREGSEWHECEAEDWIYRLEE